MTAQSEVKTGGRREGWRVGVGDPSESQSGEWRAGQSAGRGTFSQRIMQLGEKERAKSEED